MFLSTVSITILTTWLCMIYMTNHPQFLDPEVNIYNLIAIVLILLFTWSYLFLNFMQDDEYRK